LITAYVHQAEALLAEGVSEALI